jgi:ADP-dependent NAD(P)H-hydrate dehydratase / NAD(P)H-hydrate epimerase
MPAGSRRTESQPPDIAKYYPPRGKNVRKGDFGRVIVAGGSERYAGCLAFNGLAALRAGADLAIIVAPRRAADIVATYSPDLITVPCTSSFPDPEIVKELLDNADALVVGSGVVRTQASHHALQRIIGECTEPIVADAEALHAISEKPTIVRQKKILMSPNAGEFQVLSKTPWPVSTTDRHTAIRNLAKRFGTTIVVKGSEDYISDGNRVHVDLEGSPYLTKGGYGDLLAGVAGAMLARNHTPFEAARVATFVVGRAGRMAAKKFGEGTLASDALAQIAPIIAYGHR